MRLAQIKAISVNTIYFFKTVNTAAIDPVARKSGGNPRVHVTTFEERLWSVNVALAAAAAQGLRFVARMSRKQPLKVF